MTKPRAPFSFENALTRIAGLIDWPAMMEAISTEGRAVARRTLIDWSDPDNDRCCTVHDAIALDIAYRAAGGDGAPMFETYASLLELAHAERFVDQVELARRTCKVIKEVSEAEAALVQATMPGATAAHRAEALRQVEEGMAALSSTVPLLTKGEPPR